jgi:DNA-binding beta-propeller fold protein YncE/class 3 adenylate cyclase
MNAPEEASFGALLRRLRKAAGLTQEELAERAELSVRQLAYLERGRHAARPGTIRRLADALELSGQERTSLLEQAEQIATAPAADVRTFLIADVRGYTRFTVEHGDEAAARLTRVFARLAGEASSTHGGQVIETRGDEVLAVFTSSRQALRAAIDLQFRCAAAEQADPSLPLRVGIGVDAGEAVPVDGGYRGAALNLAARLCSLAGPRQVLGSEGVIHLARRTEGLIYTERGVVELKGFVEPVRVIEVLSEDEMPELPTSGGEESAPPAVVSLPIGNFLGALPAGQLAAREDELTRVLPALDAVQSGSGQLLALVGEAGVGKTRLAQEISVLARDRGFLLAAGRCHEAERGVPLVPFAEAATMAFDAAPSMTRAQAARRWPQLGRLIPDRVGVPLSEDVEEREAHPGIFRAVTGFLSFLAQQQPVALLLDDLHLSDEGSLRLLQHLARNTRTQRILIVVTYREGTVVRDDPLDRVLRDLNHERLLDRITLARLPAEGTATMVAATVGDMEAAEEFAAFVHRRSKGNPAVIDEMLRALGGRYRLVRLIGAGGMGRVFQAVDTRSGKVVAAKILFASSEADLDALLRFQQEGAVLSTLKHPNIVEVYGTFMEEHTSCIIMELLQGKSLRQVLEEEKPGLARLKAIAQQAAGALAYAHGKSIVHRDVKPDNIMVLPGDQVKVTDFGIARILRPGGTLNTMTGMTLGTPLYMAPEQIEGRAVDGRSDIYSLGAVLYQALAGRPPFDGEDPITVAFRQVQEAPVPPSSIRKGVPADWEALVLKALAKDPADRYASAAAFGHAIAALTVDGQVQPGRKKAPAAPAPEVQEAASSARRAEGRRSPLRILTPSPATVRPREKTPVPAPAPPAVAPPREAAKRRRGVSTRLLMLGIPLPIATLAVIAFFALHSPSGGSVPSSFVLGQPDPGWKVHTNTLPFNYPVGVAVVRPGPSLASGTIYVADRLNHRIARLAADGTPLTSWGSEGSGDGQLERPDAVAVAPNGSVYVADTGNNRIEEFSPDGRFVGSFGSSGTGQLNQPTDVVIADPAASCATCPPTVYVVDSGNNRLVKFTPSGKVLQQWKVPAGEAAQASLQDAAIGPGGTVFVTDSGNNQVDELKGGRLQRLFGSAGLGTGQLSSPEGIAADSGGAVYVADSNNNRIERFDPPRWKPRLWAPSTQLSSPKGMTLGSDGSLYVADSGDNFVRKLSPAGALSHSWTGAPVRGHQILDGPIGLAVDGAGDVYVADSNKDRIDEIAPDGSLLAAGGSSGSLPGQFQAPVAVAVDRNRDVYVADSLNNRIQRLSPAGVTFSAATGLASPSGITLGVSGDLYVADTGDQRIRQLTPDGTVVSSWGSGGPAHGQFQGPYGVAADSHGNIYVADQNNNRIQVFSSGGRFLFALGSSGTGIGGTRPGQFSGPYAVGVDSRGDIYVADTGNNRVQELTKKGSVLAVVGGIGRKDRFKNPEGIAVDAGGNVYVSDNGNNRIVKIVPR